jgi:hypothetical protein
MKQFVGATRRPIALNLLAMVFGVSECVLRFAGRHRRSGSSRVHQLFRVIEIQYVGPQTISKERVIAQLRMKTGQVYSESLARAGYSRALRDWRGSKC